VRRRSIRWQNWRPATGASSPRAPDATPARLLLALLPLAIALAAGPATAHAALQNDDLFKQAQTYEAAKDYAAAEGIYRRLLATDPRNCEALKRLGIVQQTGLKFDDSIKSFKRALSEHPDYPQVNFYLGLSYYGQHDLNNAIAGFERELKTPEPAPPTRYYLALAFEGEGRMNEAIDQLNQSAVQNPNNANVLYELARLHMDASFQAIERLRKLDPDSFQNHALMGGLYSDEHNYEAAVREYEAALEKQPDATGIHYPLAVAYRMLHQFEPAEKQFRLALQESPDDPRSNLGLGDVALLQRQFAVALPYLKAAAAKQSNDVETHILLGRCYVGLGELEQAESEFELAARLDPKEPRCHYFLAEVYQKLNRPADRERELQLSRQLSGARQESLDPGAHTSP